MQDGFNLRPRHCNKCRDTYFTKIGEITHEQCDGVKDWTGKFNVKTICDKCLSVRSRCGYLITHRLYYPAGCIAESYEIATKTNRNSAWTLYYKDQIICENKNHLFPEDYQEYQRLLNTRVLWNKNGSYKIEVIDDPKERDAIDEHFLKVIAKYYDPIIRADEYYKKDYEAVLAYRIEKDLERAGEDIIDSINNILNPDDDDE